MLNDLERGGEIVGAGDQAGDAGKRGDGGGGEDAARSLDHRQQRLAERRDQPRDLGGVFRLGKHGIVRPRAG